MDPLLSFFQDFLRLQRSLVGIENERNCRKFVLNKGKVTKRLLSPDVVVLRPNFRVRIRSNLR